MRILFAHSGADLYGASRSFLRLSTRLVADGHAVLALLPCHGPLIKELEAAGVEAQIDRGMTVFTRKQFASTQGVLKLFSGLPGAVYRTCSIIRQFRPEIVHTNTALPISPAIAAKLCHVPHLWHIREFFVDFPRLWPLYQKMVFRLSDRIACVSRAVADQFQANYQRKIIVLHNGFPKDEFGPVTPARADFFRQQFNLNGHRLVGLVGRIKFGRKGQEVFVKAAASIKDRFPDAKFLCIGSPFHGNEEHLVRLKELAERVNLGDQFVYTGDVEDIKAAYSALDVSVLASAQPEPFGGVVIESMAMGIPVVGTAIGGTLEQIEDESTGILVPPGDAEAMAAAIARLLSSKNLRAQYGIAAKQRFLDRFEFEPFYQKLSSLYRLICDKKAAYAQSLF